MSFSTLTQTLQAQVKGLLYLHTDRESYAPGEAVSLKSYLINSNQLLPSDDSLNILLQNLRGEWLIHQTYPITNNSAKGTLVLPDDLVYGEYTLKACTNSSLNSANPDIFKTKIIIRDMRIPPFSLSLKCTDSLYFPGDQVQIHVSIKNLKGKPVKNYPFSFSISRNGIIEQLEQAQFNEQGEGRINVDIPANDQFTITSVTVSATVQDGYHSNSMVIPTSDWPVLLNIYPEGGRLIEGVNNRIGLYTTNPLGQAISVEVILFDDEDRQVASFHTNQFGLAVFNLLPDIGNPHYLRLVAPGIQENEFDLPEIHDEGLHCTYTGKKNDELLFSLSPAYYDEVELSVKIIGDYLGQNVYSESIRVVDDTLVRIPVKSLPAGLIRFSFFNDDIELLAQRPVFNYQPIPSIPIEVDLPDDLFADNGTIRILQGEQYLRFYESNLSLSVLDVNMCPFTGINPDIRSYSMLGKLSTTMPFEPNYVVNNPNFSADLFDPFIMGQIQLTTIESLRIGNNPAKEFSGTLNENNFLKNERISELHQLNSILRSDQYLTRLTDHFVDHDHYVSANRSKLQNWNFFPSPLTKEEIAQNMLDRGLPIISVLRFIKSYRKVGNGLYFKPTGSFNFDTPALIIIDGVERGYDIEVFRELNPYNIKKLEVFTTVSDMLKYTAAMGASGIVVVTSKTAKDFLPEEKEIPNPLDNYNPTIKWVDQIDWLGTHSAIIKLDYLKLKSNYQIIVQGVSKDGKPIGGVFLSK